MAEFSAVARFSAQDKYSKTVIGMGRTTERFAQKSQASFRKVEKSASGLQKRIRGIGSSFKQLVSVVSIAAVLTTGANAIVQYDKASASLMAITGATTEQMVEYKAEVLSTAKATKQSSVDIAKAFELVGSAKPELLSSAKALGEVSKQAFFLSKAGGLEMEDAVGALTVSLNQFGAGANEAAKFTDILATAQQKGSGTISFLSEAIVKAGGISKAFGNSFEDTVAILEGFAKAGVPASESGTQLAGILSKLTKVQKKEFNPQFTKATDIINNLAKANLSYTDLLKMTDARGAQWITTIINQNKTVQELAGNLHDVNNAQSQAAINTSTLSDRFIQLKSSFENAAIANTENSTGLFLLDKVLVFAADHMDVLIGMVAGLAAVMIPAIALYKTIAAVTTVYNAALAMSALLSGKGAIALKGNVAALKIYATWSKVVTMAQWAWNAAMTANPIGLIVVAIAAAIGAIAMLVKHWDTLKEKFTAAPTWVKVALLPLIMATAPLLILVNTIKKVIDAWAGIKTAFSEGGIGAGLKKLGGVILSALIDPMLFFLKILAKIPGVGGKIEPLIQKVEGFQRNAEGGFGVDEQLAGQQPEAINTQATQNVVQSELVERKEQNINLNINDPNNRATVDSGPGPIKPKVNNTVNQF